MPKDNELRTLKVGENSEERPPVEEKSGPRAKLRQVDRRTEFGTNRRNLGHRGGIRQPYPGNPESCVAPPREKADPEGPGKALTASDLHAGCATDEDQHEVGAG